MKFDTTAMKALVLQKLNEVKLQASKDFQESAKNVGTKYVSIPNFLPESIALEIHKAFTPDSSSWREMKSFRERKLTTKQYDKFPSILGEITFTIQEPEVIRLVEEITQIKKQIGDPGLYAGGLSVMREGDFLNPHIDNSHDQNREAYRRLNLLYYVTPNWTLADGGNLELWDNDVQKKVTIESKFNTLVIMETNSTSWHSVSKVIKSNGLRYCVSNYYFSPESPLDYDYFHITAFKGRPDEPFKRIISNLDSLIRTTVRKVKKSGLGRKDLYKS